MLAKLQEFFLEKFLGKLVARAAITAAAFVAGSKVQGAARSVGISVSVDPQQLSEGAVLLAHAAFEAFKAWRARSSEPKA